MPKRSSRSDLNQNAFNVVQQATGESKRDATAEKNPAAVALGRLGGLKGGKARAEKLSKGQRAEIAKRAALSRWKRGRP